VPGLRRVTEIEVSAPVGCEEGAVNRALHVYPARVLELAFGGASGTGEALARLRLGRLGGLGVRALVELRTPTAHERTAPIALRWRARRGAALFPVMEATLRARPASAGGSVLVFSGRYLVPFGLVGIVADQLIGARGARATAHRFVADVARVIDALVEVA